MQNIYFFLNKKKQRNSVIVLSKNIEKKLRLDLPGSLILCGDEDGDEE